jgi:hypothetical protein
MNKINLYLLFLLPLLFFISCSDDKVDNVDPEPEYTIWNGGKITFEKADGADPTSALAQDRITDLVWITRGNSGGQIYNIAKETIYDKDKSPLGTKWAIGTLQQIDQLSFDDFRATVGSPKDVVGKNLVLYLQDHNTYLSVKFTSWSSGNKGGFAYERSTP